ncbi:MAG TPA: tetratricopeptide repeat protein [Candidatus Sulfotelmatobacter sp.]|jgi:hypothetical protein|nr:tetratricopeptide repeat protein [Candidatus Sulfotelmatobacter sp.]
MKQKLSQSEIVVFFPKNLRFITEYTFSESQSRTIKITLVSILSLFLLTFIVVQVIVIWDNVRQQEVLKQQRIQLENEVIYWKGIATKYQGYRDVYYRIAALQYKLGNVAESQKYVKRALDLDPNFPEGHVLGMHVGL